MTLLFEQLSLLVLAHFLAPFLDHASHFIPSLLPDPDSRDARPAQNSHRKYAALSVGALWIGGHPKQVKPAAHPRGALLVETRQTPLDLAQPGLYEEAPLDKGRADLGRPAQGTTTS